MKTAAIVAVQIWTPGATKPEKFELATQLPAWFGDGVVASIEETSKGVSIRVDEPGDETMEMHFNGMPYITTTIAA